MDIMIDEVRHFEIVSKRLVSENMVKLNEEESSKVVKLMEQCFLYGLEFGINKQVKVAL